MTLKEGPLVSVVSPVYNCEEYLRECIVSVLAQTYTDWDFTIVNNCSTDRTLDIAREYAAMDSRIRIRNNEIFVPVIENHNIAFRQISPKSKYCKVLAGDDWLFPECLERMVALAEEHPSVAIVGSYRLQGTRVTLDGMPYPSTVVKGREACRLRLLHGPSPFGAPTSVLYRSDIVRSRYAFYNEANLHADTEACLEFLEDLDFGFVHQVLSFTREREGSLTTHSADFNTYFSGNLHGLVKYGPKYLSQEESRQRIRRCLRSYYSYLGCEWFKFRGRVFWNFHREKLAAEGYPLSSIRLVASAVSFGLDLAFNPKSTAERLVRRLPRILSALGWRM